jgi:2-oxoglutarate ferredoxin oxidoreductase subunit beta
MSITTIKIKTIKYSRPFISIEKYNDGFEKGKVAKSTPFGSVEEPFNPAEIALGAKCTFVSRSLDRDPKHMQTVLRRANGHRGTSFVEIYQNCPVFNDGTFFAYSEKETKKETALFVEQDKPLVFGNDDEKGIWFDGLTPRIINYKEMGVSVNDLWIHNEHDKTKANILSRFYDITDGVNHFPRPFGVLYAENRPTYEEGMTEQIETLIAKKGKPTLDSLLSGEKTWTIL